MSVVRKTIVQIDLARYSSAAESVEEILDSPEAVATYTKLIQDIIYNSLTEIMARSPEVPHLFIGDGALLSFDDATDAVQFAVRLHDLADKHSAGKREERARMHFRVGIATGLVHIGETVGKDRKFVEFAMMGSTVIRAARLEASCRTGEILLSSNSWGDLLDEERKMFGNEQTVVVKRGVTVQAHRRKVVDSASWEDLSLNNDTNTENIEARVELSILRDTALRNRIAREIEILVLEMIRTGEDSPFLTVKELKKEILGWKLQ